MDVKRLREDNENLLDKEQQTTGYITQHFKKEQEERTKAIKMEVKINELEEKLTRKADCVQEVKEATASPMSNSATNSDDLHISFGGSATVLELDLRIEKLQDCLRKEHEEKEKLQDRFNQLDDESFKLSLALEYTEYERNDYREKASRLEKAHENCGPQLRILHQVTQRSRGLTEQDKQELLLLKDCVEDNDRVKVRNASLEAELDVANKQLRTNEKKS